MRICDLLNLTESVSWGSMNPKAARQLLSAYNSMAPSIEKYRDETGADRLYHELETIAKQNKEQNTFKRMIDSARGWAHMEYDTNPGHFKNWFWVVGEMLEKIAEPDEEGGIEIGQDN